MGKKQYWVDFVFVFCLVFWGFFCFVVLTKKARYWKSQNLSILASFLFLLQNTFGYGAVVSVG